MAFNLEAFLDQGLGLRFGGYRPCKFDAVLDGKLEFRINKITLTEFAGGLIQGILYVFEDEDFSSKTDLPKVGSTVPLVMRFYAKNANLLKTDEWPILIECIETDVDWGKVDQVLSYRVHFTYISPLTLPVTAK